MAEELAELVTDAETGVAARLPRQLVHGDFWDNNVGFRRGRPVLLADFDFMGERARVDDLALTLWCARCGLSTVAGPAEELVRLRRLVASYDAGLDIPLSATEQAALPVAMARQPLSSIGGWVARLDDEAAALQVMTELGRWQDASPEPGSGGRTPAGVHRAFVGATGEWRAGPVVAEFEKLYAQLVRETAS